MAVPKKTVQNPLAKKPRTKKVVKDTHVVLVVDRSGSMGTIRSQALSGINEQFNALRTTKVKNGTTSVSVVLFDGEIDTPMLDVNSNDLVDWTDSQYVPHGSTALRDATWRAIAHLKTKPVTENTAFLVVVISDGGENASTEVSQQQLTEEIKKLEVTKQWTFTYMLANQNIQNFVRTMGVSANNVASFTSTPAGMVHASCVMSSSVAGYMQMRSVSTKNATSNFYDSTTAPVSVDTKIDNTTTDLLAKTDSKTP